MSRNYKFYNPKSLYFASFTALKENPVYGLNRLGVFYRQNTGEDATKYTYQLTDHLGNVRAVVKKTTTGIRISGATDYYPFGMPMPNRHKVDAEGYRYAYQGQEKDPETGKEAFELRLWDSRIGRWLTIDPYSEFYSPYIGMGNNPIVIIDPDGGVTSGCPFPPCDKDGNVKLDTVVLTYQAPESSGWSDFITNLISYSRETGKVIGVFTMNAYATAANNNLTLGIAPLPDASTYGDYELSARFGRLAGNFINYVQGQAEDGLAITAEIATVGGSTEVSIPLAIHGAVIQTAAVAGSAKETAGIVKYFSRKIHNAGKGGGIGSNSKRFTDTDMAKYFGEGWHDTSKKGNFLKDFYKKLRGDHNADFYYNKDTKEILLRSNKSQIWIKTGRFYNK